MAKNPNSAISKCSGLLQQLISKKLESPDSGDAILQQYKAFITEVQKYHKDEFVAYNSEQGLDSFLYGDWVHWREAGVFQTVGSFQNAAYTFPWSVMC